MWRQQCQKKCVQFPPWSILTKMLLLKTEWTEITSLYTNKWISTLLVCKEICFYLHKQKYDIFHDQLRMDKTVVFNFYKVINNNNGYQLIFIKHSLWAKHCSATFVISFTLFHNLWGWPCFTDEASEAQR